VEARSDHHRELRAWGTQHEIARRLVANHRAAGGATMQAAQQRADHIVRQTRPAAAHAIDVSNRPVQTRMPEGGGVGSPQRCAACPDRCARCSCFRVGACRDQQQQACPPARAAALRLAMPRPMPRALQV
jgi:hypothetical protein